MKGRGALVAKAALWGLLVIVAVIMLIEGFMTRNLYAILMAAFATYVAKQTSKYIPIPKIYRDQGITEDMFQGKYRRKEARK